MRKNSPKNEKYTCPASWIIRLAELIISRIELQIISRGKLEPNTCNAWSVNKRRKAAISKPTTIGVCLIDLFQFAKGGRCRTMAAIQTVVTNAPRRLANYRLQTRWKILPVASIIRARNLVLQFDAYRRYWVDYWIYFMPRSDYQQLTMMFRLPWNNLCDLEELDPSPGFGQIQRRRINCGEAA